MSMKLNEEQLALIKKHKNALNPFEILNVDMCGGLFPRGFVSILASPPGVGKTWIMLRVATLASLGKSLLGEIIPPQKTLIFAGETSNELLNYRISQTTWEYDENKIVVYSGVNMKLDNIPCDLNSPMGLEVIKNIILQEMPDMVFFDTLIAFNTADESKMADMSSVYLTLGRMAKFFNCAVVCNHHTRKRSQQNISRELMQDDVIGSSAGIRLAASVFILDVNLETEIITLKNVKSWNQKLPAVEIEFTEDDAANFDMIIKGAGVALGSAKRRLMELIFNMADEGTFFYTDELAIEFKISEKSVRRILRPLTEYDTETGRRVLKQFRVDTRQAYVGVLNMAELGEERELRGIARIKSSALPHLHYRLMNR